MNKSLITNGQQSSVADNDISTKTPDNTPDVKNVLSGNTKAGRNLEVEPDPGGTVSEDERTRLAKTFQKALYESETDLVNATMTIMGDPYFLADSGMGNFSNTGSGRFNITETNAMDYQSGEVDIIVNFRTPLDYDQDTGIMTFGNTEIVEQFSGLYRVDFVNNRFSRGKYTQELKMQRRSKQNPEPVSDDNSAFVGINIYAEDGTLSNLRRNPETGELYDATGLPAGSDRFSEKATAESDSSQRATANPKDTSQVNKATTVSSNSATPAMTDAEIKKSFNNWMGP